jgi:hypothetical protein
VVEVAARAISAPQFAQGGDMRPLLRSCHPSSVTCRNAPYAAARAAARLLWERNHAKQAVCIVVRPGGKEQLVMGAVWSAVLAELERPNVIYLNWFASRVSKGAEEGTRARVKRVDSAPGNVVADQNHVAHRTKITRRLRQTPGRMKRAVDRKVLLQLTVRSEPVHEATLPFV